MDKEKMEEHEDPDRYFADQMEDQDPNNVPKKRGKGRGKGKGKGRGKGRGKGKEKGAKGKQPPEPQEELPNEDDPDGLAQGAGEKDEVPGEMMEVPKQRVKPSPKAKGTRRRELLKRANSKSMQETPRPKKRSRKHKTPVPPIWFVFLKFSRCR